MFPKYEIGINKYADATQTPFFDFKMVSNNLAIFNSVKEFNEREAGSFLVETEEKLFGTHLKELKDTLGRLIGNKTL